VADGGATSDGAHERLQHWFCVFPCRLPARLTQAGAVMAAKKEAQPKDESDETEAAAGSEGEEGAKKPSGGLKRFLSIKFIAIAAVGVIAVSGIGGGAYHFLGSRTEAAPAAKVKPPVFFDMPDILVNLSSSGSDRTQYLKVKVVLELPDEAMKAQIEPLMPRVMDMFQTYLRELRATDLDGSAGLYRLKEELTRRVNAAIAPDHINAVLFKEIVVQ
jgi:flagellar protein FliL